MLVGWLRVVSHCRLTRALCSVWSALPPVCARATAPVCVKLCLVACAVASCDVSSFQHLRKLRPCRTVGDSCCWSHPRCLLTTTFTREKLQDVQLREASFGLDPIATVPLVVFFGMVLSLAGTECVAQTVQAACDTHLLLQVVAALSCRLSAGEPLYYFPSRLCRCCLLQCHWWRRSTMCSTVLPPCHCSAMQPSSDPCLCCAILLHHLYLACRRNSNRSDGMLSAHHLSAPPPIDTCDNVGCACLHQQERHIKLSNTLQSLHHVTSAVQWRGAFCVCRRHHDPPLMLPRLCQLPRSCCLLCWCLGALFARASKQCAHVHNSYAHTHTHLLQVCASTCVTAAAPQHRLSANISLHSNQSINQSIITAVCM